MAGRGARWRRPNPKRLIFNEGATERLRSPDDLEKFVRVTNPSVWLGLGACVALLVGLLVWGIFGAVTTTMDVTGVYLDNGGDDNIVCFLSAAEVAKVHEGDEAVVDGHKVQVKYVQTFPTSREDMLSELDNQESLLASLVKEDWSYMVILDGDVDDLFAYVPLSIRITIDSSSPLSLVLDA